MECVSPPNAHVFVFLWEDLPGLHVPMMRISIGDDESSQRPQDCTNRVTEGEVACIHKHIHDRYDDFPDDDRESVEEERRMRAEGRVRREGEDDQEGVSDAKNSSHDYENYCYPLVQASEVYGETREEQKDRRVEEGREESNESMNFQLLKRHKPDVSLAGTKKAENRVRTAGVLREPTFTNNCAETGAETGEETGEPKTIDRDRRICRLLGDSRVGYVCQLWVATVQQLMEEYGRLSLVVRI